MLATGSHRRVSNWRDAVEEWNRTNAQDGGWRSSFNPQMACPKCPAKGIMLTTIHGATTATCSCGHSWLLA